MKRILWGVLKTLLGLVAVIVVAAAVLVVRWLVRHEDPSSFLPDRYVAYVQVPSLRGLYDQWLNLEAADIVLARPDLAPYRRVVTDARGLALTSSPILRALLDVRADVMLLPDRKFLAVLDLEWRGVATPLARLVGPVLRLKGFSFINDAGTPLYRYTTGGTTIHVALVNNIAVVSLDADTVSEALARRASNTGLAAKASRELLDRIRLRSRSAVRVLVDTGGISTELLAGSPLGAKILEAVEIPGQSMLDVQVSDSQLRLGAALPVSVSMPELAKILGTSSPLPISPPCRTCIGWRPPSKERTSRTSTREPTGAPDPWSELESMSCSSPGWEPRWGRSCCRDRRKRSSSRGSTTSAPTSARSARLQPRPWRARTAPLCWTACASTGSPSRGTSG
jgi:hypothetical protein